MSQDVLKSKEDSPSLVSYGELLVRAWRGMVALKWQILQLVGGSVVSVSLLAGVIVWIFFPLDPRAILLLIPLLQILAVPLTIGMGIVGYLIWYVWFYRLVRYDTPLSLLASGRWVGHNLLRLVWLWMLYNLATVGAYALFIVCGLVPTMYLLFSNIVLFREHRPGMDALLRSVELVKGHFWAVTGRVAIMSILILTILLLHVLAAYGLTAYLLLLLPLTVFLCVSFWVLGVTILYQSLCTHKPAGSFEREKYVTSTYVLVGLMVFTIISVLVSLAYGDVMLEVGYEEFETTSIDSDVDPNRLTPPASDTFELE